MYHVFFPEAFFHVIGTCPVAIDSILAMGYVCTVRTTTTAQQDRRTLGVTGGHLKDFGAKLIRAVRGMVVEGTLRRMGLGRTKRALIVPSYHKKTRTFTYVFIFNHSCLTVPGRFHQLNRDPR